MDKTKPLYLFFDLDGTVLINYQLPPEHLEAMRWAQSLGHKLILNTGRSRGGYKRVPVAEDIPWDGRCFSAAEITYEDKLLDLKTVSEQDFMIWLDYCLEHRFRLAYCGREWLEFLEYDQYDLPLSDEQKQELRKQAMALFRQNPLTNVSIHATLDPTTFPKSGLVPIQLPGYADLFPDGCSKGNVIRIFCEKTGVPLEQCVCFGDSPNDIDMFRACPTGICMKWAPPALSSLATYHAKTDRGVAEGLHYLLDGTEPVKE